jgi:hypothetical protein
MTDDELRLHLESLHASVHELYESVQRHDALREQDAETIRKNSELIRALAILAQETLLSTQQLERTAADALASVQSLERIATAHEDRLDDHQERLEDLEGK